MTMTRTPDLMADCGRALYGDRFASSLAHDLGISRKTVQRWMTGHTPLPADHWAWDDLRDLLIREADRRRDELLAVAARI
jgi:hypothetical protein